MTLDGATATQARMGPRVGLCKLDPTTASYASYARGLAASFCGSLINCTTYRIALAQVVQGLLGGLWWSVGMQGSGQHAWQGLALAGASAAAGAASQDIAGLEESWSSAPSLGCGHAGHSCERTSHSGKHLAFLMLQLGSGHIRSVNGPKMNPTTRKITDDALFPV